ncbi:MAG TPA: hypothetical protein VGQ55_00170 [Pyrinomonadaceae bacterium]|nr:hypothetical protein [Pyrinomonadaceae bacterium]
MATIVEPVSFEKEEKVKIPTVAECIAVSGYANFFNEFHPDSGLPLSFASPGHNMIGDLNDDDNLWIHYEAHLLVGPKWSL